MSDGITDAYDRIRARVTESMAMSDEEFAKNNILAGRSKEYIKENYPMEGDMSDEYGDPDEEDGDEVFQELIELDDKIEKLSGAGDSLFPSMDKEADDTDELFPSMSGD